MKDLANNLHRTQITNLIFFLFCQVERLGTTEKLGQGYFLTFISLVA